jgi:hypothetical protein
MSWTLVLPERLYDQLRAHLFPGDDDEHGAVLAAGVARGDDNRLLVRDIFLARDGVDYVPGQRGYRMLTAAFVREGIRFCRREKLAYLAVHCHGIGSRVRFSSDDMASHERGYPALAQINEGRVVGGVVVASEAIAGDLWLPDGTRATLARAVVVGSRRLELRPAPLARTAKADEAYDRQARLFGDRGQALLRSLHVGIIGAGGVGSLLNEYVARLGVGRITIVDPDRFDLTNHSRVVGSRGSDAAGESPPRPATLKVDVAQRVWDDARTDGTYDPQARNVIDDDIAGSLSRCDYLFLAADSAQARLVFNALVHQYLIPGVQVGAKIVVDADTGVVNDVFTWVRFVEPGYGCLMCNGLISASALQLEALTPEERRRQRYVDEPDIPAPSVITLNAVGAAHAVDDFLFNVHGLRPSIPHPWLRFRPLRSEITKVTPSQAPACGECSTAPNSRLARGDELELPTRLPPPSR